MSTLAIQIIDTPVFQRLHDIKQNGFAYRVFPTVKTSRFEHSLGVYHITKYLLQHIQEKGLEERTKELIAIAGLVHDIGHGPFSHWSDEYIFQDVQSSWNHHEQRSCDLFSYLVHQYCQGSFTENDIQQIQHWIRGNTSAHWYDHLIHNSITGLDMDKIDYLLRDIQSFGLAYRFDPYRLLHSAKIIDQQLCFCDKVRDEILMMFMVRNKLRHHIYRHPKIQQMERFMSDQVPRDLYHRCLQIAYSKDCAKFIQLQDSVFSTMEGYYQRPPPLPPNSHPQQGEEDTEWQKIRNIYFYSRKQPSLKFHIQSWNLVSCFEGVSGAIHATSK